MRTRDASRSRRSNAQAAVAAGNRYIVLKAAAALGLRRCRSCSWRSRPGPSLAPVTPKKEACSTHPSTSSSGGAWMVVRERAAWAGGLGSRGRGLGKREQPRRGLFGPRGRPCPGSAKPLECQALGVPSPGSAKARGAVKGGVQSAAWEAAGASSRGGGGAASGSASRPGSAKPPRATKRAPKGTWRACCAALARLRRAPCTPRRSPPG